MSSSTKKGGVRKVKAWGGFVDGRLDRHLGVQYGYDFGPTLRAVFTNKKEAKERYSDVRLVEISFSLPTKTVKKAK